MERDSVLYESIGGLDYWVMNVIMSLFYQSQKEVLVSWLLNRCIDMYLCFCRRRRTSKYERSDGKEQV